MSQHNSRGKIIVMLKGPQTKHLLDLLLLLRIADCIQEVDVLNDQANILAAVHGHPFLDRNKVLPLTSQLGNLTGIIPHT